MKIWSVPVIIAIVALSIPMSSVYVEAQEQAKQEMLRRGDRISVVNSDNVTPTKAEILKLKGVKGNGIKTAPGLQKPFNLKSQAAEHAGKKDENREEEQLRIRQNTENHGDAKGQIKIEQKVKNQR